MTKITLRLDTRYKLKDGTFPLKIAIARGKSGNTLYLPIGINLRIEDWNNERQIIIGKDIPNRTVLTSYIRQKFIEVETKLIKLQENGDMRSYTDKELITNLSTARRGDKRKTLSKNILRPIHCAEDKQQYKTYIWKNHCFDWQIL